MIPGSDGTGWVQGVVGTTPIPGLNSGEITAPPGGESNVAFCNYDTSGPNSSDQWLITPSGDYGGKTLTFWMENQYGNLYADYIEILTADKPSADPEDFTMVDSISFADASPWKEYTIELADGVQAVAWREHVADNGNEGSYNALDLISIQ